MCTEKIVVFDSGVGGVSVLRHLRRLLPKERFLYFGDCANAPYGVRTTQQVRELTMTAISRLLDNHRVKALVIACNTATSAAIAQLRATYPEMIVIGIEPALKPAADRFPAGNIGIMATEVTLREKKLAQLMDRYGEKATVSRISAPGLVELVEQGKGRSPEAKALLEPILRPYAGKLDALVLGCTHYPFAEAVIREILGEEPLILDGGEGTARETRRRLVAAGLLYDGEEDGGVEIESSGARDDFAALVQQLME